MDPTTQYAGFWIRFLAAVLDSFIFGFVMGIIMIFVSLTKSPTVILVVNGLLSFALIAVIIYFEGVKGGTPGKMILSLKIVNEQGEFIGVGKAILRYVGKIISSMILCIGFFMIGWTKQKQGLHDMITKSYVVKK